MMTSNVRGRQRDDLLFQSLKLDVFIYILWICDVSFAGVTFFGVGSYFVGFVYYALGLLE
jgi:hypothetical protein